MRQTTIRLLLGIVLITLSGIPEITASENSQANLLKNGDFSSGYKYWGKSGWGPKLIKVVDSGDKTQGKAARITGNGVSWHFVSQAVELENNKTYRLKLKGKTDGKCGGTIQVRGFKPGSKSPWGKKNRLVFKQDTFKNKQWQDYAVEFTVPDSARAQNKVLILLGTSSWKDKGTYVLYDDVVLEAVDKQTESLSPETAVSENLLLNGGFEFGLSDWLPRAHFSFAERGVRQVDNDPYEGRFCLEAENREIRYPFDNKPAAGGGRLITNWTRAEPGHTYYLSLALKGSVAGQKASFRLLDGKVMDPVWKSPKKRVRLTRNWQIYTLTATVPEDVPLNKLLVEIDVGQGGKFWLDAVKLTKDKPASRITRIYDNIGVAVKLGRFPAVFKQGEAAEIILDAVNSGTKSQKITIGYKLVDVFDKILQQDSYQVELAGGKQQRKKLKLDTSRRGRFELYTRTLDAQGKLVRAKRISFAILKPVKTNPRSPVGVNINSTWRRGRTINDNFGLLGTYGYSWVREWLAWRFAKPFDNGKFDWREFDRLVDTARRNHLYVLGLLTLSWESRRGPFSWRQKHFYGLPVKDNSRPNRDFTRWLRFVKATVERYKSKIKLWEIQNEPMMNPPACLKWFNALVKATYPVIKSADPGCRVIACSPGDNGSKTAHNSHLFIEDFLKNGGYKYCDLIGLHPYTGTGSPIYGNLQGTLDQIRGWIRQTGGNQEIIMTEAGNYNTIGGYNLDGNNLAQASLQTQCWLIAWANRTQHFQHAGTPAFGSRRSCYDPVLIPNATFCAANVLAELFNESKYDSCKWIEMPKQFSGIYGFEFINRDDLVLALWSIGLPRRRLISLPVKPELLTLTNLMGNPVKLNVQDGRPVIPVSSELAYLRIRKAAGKEAASYLRKAEVIKSGSGPGQASLTGIVHPGETHAVGFTPPPVGPFAVSDQGFVKDWLIIGPFANPGARGASAGFNHDFLKPIGGEAAIRLRPDMSVFYEFPENYRIPRREVKATGTHSRANGINLKSLMSPGEYVVGYAYTQVTAPKPMKVQLCVGSDDGIKVWVNGKEVINRRIYRGARPDQDRAEITLRKGVNRIMVKVDTDTGGWKFFLRFLDKNGQPVKNIKIGW